jgi:hypothetical protein
MDDNIHKFHIAEYSALRSQLVDLYKTSNNWMIYVTSANFFLVAWTEKAGCGTNKLCHVTACLPIIVTLIGFALYWIHARTTDAIIDYLNETEKKFYSDGGCGAFLKNRKTGRIISTRRVTSSIYVLQFAGSILFLTYFECWRAG